MPSGIKVTRELFRQIKQELVHSEPLTVAIKNKMSVKTILQVKGSADYSDYEAMKRAQHPPVKHSMRDQLNEINTKVDKVLALAQENKLF
jgi:hypothetical protein